MTKTTGRTKMAGTGGSRKGETETEDSRDEVEHTATRGEMKRKMESSKEKEFSSEINK